MCHHNNNHSLKGPEKLFFWLQNGCDSEYVCVCVTTTFDASELDFHQPNADTNADEDDDDH